VALEALGLGFYSIDVGLGVLITDSAYACPDFDLRSAAVVTIVRDVGRAVGAALRYVAPVGMAAASAAAFLF
jgi:SNF family Na+-dependent transporter